MIEADALRYLMEEQASANRHQIHGREYSDKKLFLVPEPMATPLHVSTLSGLVDYANQGVDNLQGDEAIVFIQDEKTVELLTSLDAARQRETLIVANFDDAFSPETDDWLGPEAFIIQLMTRYAPSQDRDDLVDLVSNVTFEDTKEIRDDGVSQSLVRREGARLTVIHPPKYVKLRPFRTFKEIEQPESPFLLRINKQKEAFALFDSDGGVWKFEALESIARYFYEKLGDITVIK
jgi:hypothetical protein